ALIAILFATPAVTDVRIEAHWRGLGEPSDEHYTIKIAEYRDAVARLVRALDAQPVKRAEAMQMLADPLWLGRYVDIAYGSIPLTKCSAEARKLFADTFTDARFASTAFESYYTTSWTDDHPSMTVTVRFADGHTASASSRSQHALMLPWSAPRGDT